MNRLSHNKKRLAIALIAAWLPLSTGCKAPWSSDWKMTDMFRMDKGMPWHDDGPEKGVPARLVATWTDTMLQQAGKTPQRGFGGRLVFYGKKDNQPILVDGQLVVYAFDESQREPADNRPTRRYVFPPDQVELRMSESELGPSYSFWLPWDEVGGAQTEVSLIARFEPKGGAVVVSEQTRHLLPGQLAPGTMLAKNTPPKLPDGIPMRPAVQPPSSAAYGSGETAGTAHQAAYAVYESPVAGAPAASGMPSGVTMPQPSPRRMSTTSISLPENFRLRGGTPAAPSANPSSGAQPIRQPVQSTIPAMPAPAVGQPVQGGGRTNYVPLSAGGDAQAPARMPYTPTAAMMPQAQPATYNGFGSGITIAPIQPMPPQQQMPAASQMTTGVNYSSPADSNRWASRPQSSGDYQPPPPQVPATPAFR